MAFKLGESWLFRDFWVDFLTWRGIMGRRSSVPYFCVILKVARSGEK